MIQVPRFKRNPIDTSVYNQAISWVKRPSLNLVDRIRYYVTKETGVDPLSNEEYQGQEFVTSRQLFAYFIRKYAKLSLYATGRLMGKDHSTIVYSEKCVNKFRSTEAAYSEIFEAIEKGIKKLKHVN